jgi:hypothetical protein
MSRGNLATILAAGIVGFVAYLALTGVTVRQAGAWVERQLGIRAEGPDIKSVPYAPYGPVMVPGK